jgi:hypothetical protein
MTSPTADYDESRFAQDISPLLAKDAPTNKRPRELRTSHRTIVLTATNPYTLIAGTDPARIAIFLNVMDNPVVLSGSISEASDANNLSGTMSAPNGRLMQVGNDYWLRGNDDQYISTNTYPTRIGITILREV